MMNHLITKTFLLRCLAVMSNSLFLCQHKKKTKAHKQLIDLTKAILNAKQKLTTEWSTGYQVQTMREYFESKFFQARKIFDQCGKEGQDAPAEWSLPTMQTKPSYLPKFLPHIQYYNGHTTTTKLTSKLKPHICTQD